MAKGIRYTGEFMSIAGSRYRAEIWQEGFTGKPVELTFPYETPVSIEWAEVDKLEPVMSSAATLMVVSETDRQFVNLYTTQAGSTRLDIYRNNKLYWSGMLDPRSTRSLSAVSGTMRSRLPSATSPCSTASPSNRRGRTIASVSSCAPCSTWP